MKVISLIIGCFLILPAFSQVKVKKIADLDDKMEETSGLVYYDKKYLITHNDGGNKSELFLLDLQGKLLKTIDIKDTKNRDWEDITSDNRGNLYIGDFGNNENKREKLQIYILKKGFVDEEEVEPDKITFEYPDQKEFPPKKKDMNYDCEAMIYKDGYLYLFTKCRTKPYTGISKIYRVPAREGKYDAEYIGELPLCNLGWKFCSVTAADYSQNLNTLVLLTYGRIYFISNFSGYNFWEGDINGINLSFIKQREAICFKNNTTLYMTDEFHPSLRGGNLYELSVDL